MVNQPFMIMMMMMMMMMMGCCYMNLVEFLLSIAVCYQVHIIYTQCVFSIVYSGVDYFLYNTVDKRGTTLPSSVVFLFHKEVE